MARTLDPAGVDALLSEQALLGCIEAESVWDAAITAEPSRTQTLPATRVDAIAQALADCPYLNLPYTLGHSTSMARLA